MDDFWKDIDDEILSALGDGPVEPAEVARRLGVSESSVSSLILGLVRDGKVRVCLVEATVMAASLR